MSPQVQAQGRAGIAAGRITVVMTAHNSGRVIGRALRALPADVGCIVVDNASRDDTIAVARTARPDAAIVALPRNLGFGRGCNAGLALVVTGFAAVLNPDLFVAPDCLDLCLAAADRHPEIALLGADSGAGAVAGDVRPTPQISGSFMVLRMADVAPLGFFDENIFMYFEDTDLCLRARLAGLGVAEVVAARASHLGAGSTAPEYDSPLEKARLWGQACAYFADKHRDRPEGRHAARKLRAYRWQYWLKRASCNRAAARLLARRLEGAREVRAYGPQIMFRNAFVGT